MARRVSGETCGWTGEIWATMFFAAWATTSSAMPRASLAESVKGCGRAARVSFVLRVTSSATMARRVSGEICGWTLGIMATMSFAIPATRSSAILRASAAVSAGTCGCGAGIFARASFVRTGDFFLYHGAKGVIGNLRRLDRWKIGEHLPGHLCDGIFRHPAHFSLRQRRTLDRGRRGWLRRRAWGFGPETLLSACRVAVSRESKLMIPGWGAFCLLVQAQPGTHLFHGLGADRQHLCHFAGKRFFNLFHDGLNFVYRIFFG